eukprot:TRINITY_DN12340_c0_g1_i3.p1 TRINITY_DN12340_c0_g1~~TRINITY_DN12340_c0_g1_i3.p1  ORF type:complete len:339 (+),score=114.93 TRINITY_DN12340_c0_g1_i3:86-1102(+)
MPYNTVVLGDIYWDIVAGRLDSMPQWGADRVVDSVTASLGGSAANTARHLASLQRGRGDGGRVTLLSAVGKDATGAAVLKQLEADGLHGWAAGGAPAAVVAAPTGTCIVLTGAEDRAFVSCNGANDAFDPLEDAAARAAMEDADHIHVHGYFNCQALQTEAFADYLTGLKARRGGSGRPLTVSLCTQYDAAETWTRANLKELVALSDMMFPNEIEASHICHALLGNLKRPTVEVAHAELTAAFPALQLVVSIGADGCLAGAPAAKHPPPRPLAKGVVDTTGAGDAFTAVYLLGWLAAGRNLAGAEAVAACAAAANLGAGVVVQRHGACDPPLEAADLE